MIELENALIRMESHGEAHYRAVGFNMKWYYFVLIKSHNVIIELHKELPELKHIRLEDKTYILWVEHNGFNSR